MPWPSRSRLVRWDTAARKTSGALEWLYSSRKWCSTTQAVWMPMRSASSHCSTALASTVASAPSSHGRGSWCSKNRPILMARSCHLAGPSSGSTSWAYHRAVVRMPMCRREGGSTMSRKVADCRDFPSETNCTLTISGTQSEVLQAAAEHAVSTHGHTDGPELRKQVLAMLKDEVVVPVL